MMLLLLLSLVWKAGAWGQYNPTNPAEPNYVYKNTLTVSCFPTTAGSVSGSGRYTAGTKVTVRTSANSGYVFVNWTLNGEVISTSTSFTYTTTEENVKLVANYRYQPSNPAEPNTKIQNRLYLASIPQGIASFNQTSGANYEVGKTFTFTAYPNQGYTFEGWYDGDQLVSTKNGFQYTMPDRRVYLYAKFTYTPTNPVEPEGTGQEDVNMGDDEVIGDINGDDEVDMFDLKYLVKIVLKQQDEIEAADVNQNGAINIGDITKLIEIMITPKEEE